MLHDDRQCFIVLFTTIVGVGNHFLGGNGYITCILLSCVCWPLLV